MIKVYGVFEMSEKEKMLRGEFYNTRDKELLEIYKKARKFMDIFNGNRDDDQSKILNQLFGKVGKGVWVEKPVFCDYGENITIGENTFINFNCTLLDCNKITIGKNVLIGPNVQIYTASHPINSKERINKCNKDGIAPYKTFAKPVSIGNNVWIGGNVCILPGVTIGSNSVIGAGSVVTKSIPENVVAVGNPCKIIKNAGD